jgi:UDP-GlcNAc:undecaprenyl-phosphate/decaprenyl-phosphate GlcNAc-1-phosphate transferase
MVTDTVAFLLSLMVGAVLTLLVRNRAVRWGWYDQSKSSRKIHVRPVPRLGGVAIVLAFYAPLTALLVVDSGVGRTFLANRDLVFALFIGGAAIAGLGLYDDLRGAGARLKFSVQSSVALGLWIAGLRIETITWPFGPALHLGALSLPFTLLWIVGIVNAVNLIDGLDGLAGGVAFVASVTNLVLALARGDVLLALCMAALAGAILGFLVFNFNPASIFMGDTGSMFLGYVLATVSIKTSAKSGTAVAIMVPVIALGLPIMDTFLAMFRRAILGRSLFDADRDHIHHRLMSRLHLSHRDAVLVLYGLSMLFAATALGLATANGVQSAFLLCAITAVAVVIVRKLGYLDPKGAQAATLARKRNLQLRQSVRRIVDSIEDATSLAEIWNILRPLGAELNAARFEFWFHGRRAPTGEREGLHYETERSAGTALPVELVVELRHGEALPLGSLRVAWCDARREVDRDEELMLEQVAGAVSATALRLSLPPAVEVARVISLRK